MTAWIPAFAGMTGEALRLSVQEWLAIALSLTALVIVYAVLAALRGRSARRSAV